MSCHLPTPPPDLIVADLAPVAVGGFLRSPSPTGLPVSPPESLLSRDNRRLAPVDIITGSSSVAPSETLDPRLSRAAFLSRLMSSSQDQQQPRPMFGRTTPLLMEQDLNSEQDPLEETPLSTGTQSGTWPDQETLSPSPLTSEFKIILPLDGFGRIMRRLPLLLGSAWSFMVLPVLANHGVHGVKQVGMLTLRTRARNSGNLY